MPFAGSTDSVGADLATRARDIEDSLADVITVGTMTLANPDLVERDAPARR